MSTTRPKAPSKLPATLGMLGMLALLILCAVMLERANWDRLPGVPGEVLGYLAKMAEGVASDPRAEPTGRGVAPGDTYGTWWWIAFDKMIDSIAMAWIGTVIGASLSFPLAFLAANNTAPGPLRFAIRGLFNGIRAIPDLVFAILVMLPIFGLTPTAGAMALGVNSIGTLGKLTLESIEAIDPGPMEAVRASGATWLQTMRVAVVPQMLPETMAFWLYRFEVNIRASAVLGVLGAGGIGKVLSDVIGHRLWERAGITLLVVIVVTVIVDQISASVRHRIIHGSSSSRRGRADEPEPLPVTVTA
ncbi:phosphonate ABC transporter, permease protein PhnE [Nocardioides limicola]|uniref:phosphonate ABC transporter, permease protein PhnE n=1 Tax=Nocardioides limicola TaxID=2803368 RepID=UPI00193C7422|nr:phosphonate ABC transporter, permease protein PhnE [Nocardioides sp. DJM-14]